MITTPHFLEGRILYCKLSCYSIKLEEMGIESTEWIDFAVDLRSIMAIKSTGDGDGNEALANRAVLYMDGVDSGWVIDVPWEEAVYSWTKVR